MGYHSLATVMSGSPQDAPVLEAAIDLARRLNAHLDVIALGLDPTPMASYYGGAEALSIGRTMAEAESRTGDLATKLRERLGREEISVEVLPMTSQIAGINWTLGHPLRFCDLVILPAPYGKGRGPEAEAIAEAALFAAQVPVLVLPDGCNALPPVHSAVVGWNDSPEALKATRAAMPLLKEARVDIAMIDPPARAPDRSDPGGALARWMSRLGVSPELSVLARSLPRVSDVLQRHVSDRQAEILVMGAYSHSRLREAIMGGATRHILEDLTCPVLMAH